RATLAAAMLDDAPARFSVTNCWPRICPILAPTTRAVMSAVEPAAKPLMTCTGAVGKSCACAATAGTTNAAGAAAMSGFFNCSSLALTGRKSRFGAPRQPRCTRCDKPDIKATRAIDQLKSENLAMKRVRKSPARSRARSTAAIKSRFANANGVRLHYLVAGAGEPVVLLHGYAQNSH